jgi:predicted O-methyltransferase YrrM
MSQELWTEVDDYFTQALRTRDGGLDAAVAASRTAGLPAIQVSAAQGKWLAILVRSIRARRVLEVGTLGGYSAIWMARELPPGGRLVTCEVDPAHAEVARSNIERAGLEGVVEVRLGRAIDTLAELVAATSAAGEARGVVAFDLVFIDADKESNADYFEAALRLTRPGSVIVVDNVVRSGMVVDAASPDSAIQGVRRLVDLMAKEEADGHIRSTAIQTVGTKGYDGFTVSVVT